MKRLLPYILLAFALHAIVLSADTSWLLQAPGTRVASKSITLTISTGGRPQLEAAKEEAHKPAPTKNTETPPQPPTAEPPAAELQTPKPVETKPTVPKLAAVKAKSDNPAKKAVPPKKTAKPERKITPKRSNPKPAPEKKDTPTRKPTEHASASKAQTPSKPTVRQTALSNADTAAASAMANRDGPEGLMQSALGAAVKNELNDSGLPSGSAIKDAVPMYQINPPPYYPRRARRLGLEGQVMLKVLINVSGQVDDLTVVASSGHKILDRAALSAVRKWRFEPGTEDGKKKAMWVKIPINFDLK